MSEVVEGQVNGSEGNENVTPEMIEEMQAKLNQLASSNERLLKESKDWKAKYNGVKEEVTSTKKEELEREGRLSELLELERNKSHEIQQQVAKMKRDNMKAALKYEVAKHAKDAHNIDDIVRNIDIDMIDYNEDNNSFANVDMAVDAVRKDRTYLFLGKSAPSMPSDRPSANVPVEKSLEEQISENPNAVLKQALGEFFS